MRLKFTDIVDKHKNQACVVACHGPSLNLHKEKIIELQNKNKIIRFSMNNWWDYFDEKPDYWILSNTNYPIKKYMNFLNENKLTVFYSDDGDFTDKKYIERHSNFDWLDYDQRHWEGRDCIEILTEFKNHYKKHKNFKFTRFGNNEIMWHPPRCFHDAGHSSKDRNCCDMNNPSRTTIQEFLQNITNTHQHYSTGDSVALHAISFAIIMGCNPIYVSGMDLNYTKGYANDSIKPAGIGGTGPSAFTPLRENFKNDLQILNKSAESRGIKILNLCPDPWYDCFKCSELVLT